MTKIRSTLEAWGFRELNVIPWYKPATKQVFFQIRDNTPKHHTWLVLMEYTEETMFSSVYEGCTFVREFIANTDPKRLIKIKIGDED